MTLKGKSPPFFGVSAALAVGLHLVDIALNSSIEYGDLPGQDATDSSSDSIISFVQVLLQITALVNLFVQLGGTFLFRSGLFGMLCAEFRLVLLVQPLYIALTIILGVARAKLLSTGSTHLDLWDAQGYTVLSSFHKLGALGYYACSIFAVEKLRDYRFYSHAHWMQRW